MPSFDLKFTGASFVMATRPVLTWLVLIVGEALLASVAIGAFWFQEWQYALPTPRPAALQQPVVGDVIHLAELQPTTKPIWLHFFNPACPCSRFNIDHVRDLIARFGDQVQIVAVLEADDDSLAQFKQLNLKCAAFVDHHGEFARRTGVYSTPQGVVLDEHCQLVYRGNYNLGRYCTSAETEFVRRALENCLAHRPPLTFPAAATVAIGCELPVNRVEVSER
ncbi:DUF6436 domain-containing protein [Anatilimnocola floriformis]|uniref:DUF6436 domain-containing protein n=1 Tax=Anatilimnocola floriformis TaxID=2948575 RepID=UPI0020C284D9|nr:hypothetical protein [Anatilimnocola floriformis]